MADSTITVRAGDTEPLQISSISGKADAELTTGSVSTAVIYLRKRGETTNHVDGAALDSVSISSTDNGDGTWTFTGTAWFDPAANGPGGADALTSAGTYEGYAMITWSDGDETRHPADGDLIITVRGNLE